MTCFAAPFVLSVLFLFPVAPLLADEPTDIADVPSVELKAGGDEDKPYYLIGVKKDAKAPSRGYGLVVVMPGGGGGKDFNAFVRRIHKNALGEGLITVQLVSRKWTPDQVIVWPTKKNKVAGMKFTTGDYLKAVVKDVKKRVAIDKKRIYTLSWSSGGPAAYAVSLMDKTPVKGSFVAMSVFKPDYLPSLKKARGKGYYLYHSPEDEKCPFAHAQEADKRLKKAGAKVKLESYEGGHGWGRNLYPAIRKGMAFLEKGEK